MTVLERFRICALYLNRGISPALPVDTPNAHVNIDGYSLAIQDAGELGSIHTHPDYDWTGSDVTIVVKNVAYLLHRSNLRAVSEVFNSLFDYDDKSYRKSSPCVYLPGCHPSNIEAALSHIYPTRPGIMVLNSPKQWQLIFDFAFTFKFDSLWIAASQHLGKVMDPMDKIRIGRRRGWAGVLREGLEDFSRSSQRAPSPDSEDAKVIGYDGLRTIMETRLQDSLALRSPVSHIDVPRKETASTAREETDMVLRPILAPVETMTHANHSDISSDSITMVDWSPLTSSTAVHRSVFITGLFLSELHEDSEEHAGGGRSIVKKSTPRIVEVEDLTVATALEHTPKIANDATLTTEYPVSHISSPPPSSPPVKGILPNAVPLHSSTPPISDAVLATVELRTPVDKSSNVVPSTLDDDAGRSTSDLSQSAPKTLVTTAGVASPGAAVPADDNAAGCKPLMQLNASASGEAQTSHPVPNSGSVATQVNSAQSSVLMVTAKPIPKNTQDHADARGGIPELLPIGIAASSGEKVPAALPVSPLPENIQLPLSPPGVTSPNIKDTWGGRQELIAAAVTSTLDPSVSHLPTSAALENPAQNESQSSVARSPIHEELTIENGPKNAISQVDIESQQGNQVDTEDRGCRAEHGETGQGGSNIQDGNDSSVEVLTPKQKKRLEGKLKKEKEEAEQREEAERVKNEKEQAKRLRKEKKRAERIKNETEQAEMK